jgi:signal transduction histidine kinase
VLNKDGNIKEWVGACTDITKRIEMQQVIEKHSEHLEEQVEKKTAQLREANERLLKSERLAAIGELAGMVGHDLRNPLTGIQNAAYYLRMKQESCTPENKKKMLDLIDNAIEHADKIIDDLLDYSREIRLDLAERSPRLLLQDALTLVQVPDKIKIVDDTHEEPLMRIDVVKMQRVFINIIKNAIEAMPDGGRLLVKSIQEGSNVEISFEDTGTGMSHETMARLFLPLVTTKARGMGFGLAICKRVVEAHEGNIAVRSFEGIGSTFTLTLPLEPLGKSSNGDKAINPRQVWAPMPTQMHP